MTTQTLNADPAELAKFNRLADRWWNPEGEFKPLHQINPLRLGYIEAHANGLAGKKVLDAGCGGGILAESLALRGAQVTGIDLAGDSLATARDHAATQQLEIDYRNIAVETLAAQTPGQYDIVSCMELLEHVPDPAAIVTACATLCKPGGHVFFSTIDRNPKAFLLAIVGAEYLLNLVPRGTHRYEKFIRPAELANTARRAKLSIGDISGLFYDPLRGRHKLTRDTGVNYLMHCVKSETSTS